jgi:hypothetical protein
MFSMVQDGRQPASLEEPAQQAGAVLGVHHLGVELDAEQAAAGSSTAAAGVAAVRAVTVKPGGAAVQVSPCDIHTCCWGRAGQQRPAGSAGPSGSRRTRPRRSARPCRPAPATISWKP